MPFFMGEALDQRRAKGNSFAGAAWGTFTSAEGLPHHG
jgi:hypothetical protein